MAEHRKGAKRSAPEADEQQENKRVQRISPETSKTASATQPVQAAATRRQARGRPHKVKKSEDVIPPITNPKMLARGAEIVASLERKAHAQAERKKASTATTEVKKSSAPRPDDSSRFKLTENKLSKGLKRPIPVHIEEDSNDNHLQPPQKRVKTASEPKKRSRSVADDEGSDDEGSDDETEKRPKKQAKTATSSDAPKIGNPQPKISTAVKPTASRKPLAPKSAQGKQAVPAKGVETSEKSKTPSRRAQPVTGKRTRDEDDEEEGRITKARRTGAAAGTKSTGPTTGSPTVHQPGAKTTTPYRRTLLTRRDSSVAKPPVKAAGDRPTHRKPTTTTTTTATTTTTTPRGPPENRYQLSDTKFSKHAPPKLAAPRTDGRDKTVAPTTFYKPGGGRTISAPSRPPDDRYRLSANIFDWRDRRR